MTRLLVCALVGAAVLAAGANADVTTTSRFPPGPISARASHEVASLDRIASALAGRHVSVACWSTRDWRAMQAWARRHRVRLPDAAAAFTNIRQLQIQVSPYVCEMLAAVVVHRSAGLLSTSFALGVLAHESAHAADTRAEGVAECWR